MIIYRYLDLDFTYYFFFMKNAIDRYYIVLYNNMTELKEAADYIKSAADQYIGDTDKTKVKNYQPPKSQFMETVLLVLFDWRVIFFSLLALILGAAIGIHLVYKIVDESKIFNEYAMRGISFAGHAFIVNCFIAMFTVTYYFYKKGHDGRRGPPGESGKRGEQGKNEDCDICSLKIKKFTKDDNSIIDTDLIDNTLFNQMNLMKPKSWKERVINKTLGDSKKCSNCKNDKSANVHYITGIIANYDKIITALQYLYTNEDGKTDVLGDIWGDAKNKSNIKQIKCPANSAIYRMDGVYDHVKGLKGVKIFCKNLETGELDEPTDNYIGEHPLQSSNFKYASSKCKNINVDETSVPSFLSGLSAKHSTKSVNSLGFKYCKYYA